MKLLKFLLPVFFLLSFPVFSQETDSDLKKEEQYIKGDYNPELNEPVRIDNQPVIKDTSTVKIPVSYKPIEVKVPVTFSVDTIQAAVIKREPVEKIYRNHLNAGFGFYTTPLVEFRHTSGRNNDGRYGIFLRHLSSKGKIPEVAFPGMSENSADIFGERFFPDHTLFGRFRYDRDVVHYYGYNPDVLNPHIPLDGRQRFNRFSFETELKRNELDSGVLLYAGKLGYNRTSDLFSSVENLITAGGRVFKYLDKEKVGGRIGAEIYHNQGLVDTVGFSGIVRVEPEISTRSRNWFVKAGLNMAFLLNPEDVGTAHFFPEAEVSFNVIDNIIIPYAGITGGAKRNSLGLLTEENPFMDLSYFYPVNTIEKWKAFGGIKGALSSRTSFNTMVSYGDYSNMLFWGNAWPSVAEFSPIYDNAQLLQVHGELTYSLTEKLYVGGAGDYFSYSLENETEAWHKPAVKLNLNTRYSLFNKIIATADVFYIGERNARLLSIDSLGQTVPDIVPLELDDLVDINLGIEYRYTKRLSGYLRFHNVLASRYYQWNSYPSQRFQLFGGVTLSF